MLTEIELKSKTVIRTLAGATIILFATSAFAQASGEVLEIKVVGKPRLVKTFGDNDGGELKRDTAVLKVIQKEEAPNDNGRSKEASAKLLLEKRAEKIKKIRDDVPKK